VALAYFHVMHAPTRTWSSGAPLNTPDPATPYGGRMADHTDYPTRTG
jgi:hypothetical protein